MKTKLLRTFGLGLILATPALMSPAHAQWSGPNAAALFDNPLYDYAPSVISENDTTDIWWCGHGPAAGDTDVIFHRSYNPASGFSGISVVLRPIPGTWNSQYVCDPSVVKGNFTNPADGQSYLYAMYYSGANNIPGNNNFVGLAYSNDKLNWVNYPNPVIGSVDPGAAQSNYGTGQPSTFNANGQASLFVFSTDLTAPPAAGFTNIYVRHTNDGVNFDPQVRVPGTLTDGTQIYPNSDFAYDYAAGQVYVIGALPGRNCSNPSSCRQNPSDRETYQMVLAKMDVGALLGGGGAQWTPVAYLNTDVTGFYQTHSPGFQRDPSGNITPFLPSIAIFFAGGDTDPNTWNITTSVQLQQTDRSPLKRTYGPNGHWVTTGYTAPGYNVENDQDYLFTLQKPGTAKLMSCQAGNDHFLSRDENCEGQIVLGQTGYIYNDPQPNTHLIYRCLAGSADHFVSGDAGCEGQSVEGPLGYALD